jgi:HSP20 family protein
MALLPRFSTFGPMRQEFSPFLTLFNDTFNELQKLSDSASRTFAPKFNVKEDQNNYTLEGELPGIDQKDIVIEFSDEHTLTVKGRTEHYKEEGHRPSQDHEATEANKTANSGDPNSDKTTTEVAEHAQAETYWVSERSIGEFARSFAFPAAVDQEQVKASLKNGILKVVVPKVAKKTYTKKVTIE